MRLSAWAVIAPDPAALSIEVRAVVGPVLASIGGDADPHSLPLWGPDAGERFTLFSIAPTGVVVSAIRVDVPGEGPRITARLVRWSRLQMGELAMETTRGRRVLTITLENQVFRAADEEADRIAWFVRALHASELGRPLPPGGAGQPGFDPDSERVLAIPAPRDPEPG